MQSQTFILNNYRIPRILIAVIVGAGLATAGAILQESFEIRWLLQM